MSIAAGRLIHVVTIQNAVTSRSPFGELTQEWVDGEQIRADIRAISGRELITSGAEKAEATVRVWVRFRAGITAASRLKVLSGLFAVRSLKCQPPIPDSRGTRLEILCKQGWCRD
jgi:SPP1 family predicted phage head-tail adaptor